jgi:hypothetical protein
MLLTDSEFPCVTAARDRVRNVRPDHLDGGTGWPWPGPLFRRWRLLKM